MSSSFESKLPTELRLKVYENLVTPNRRLKRPTASTKRSRRSDLLDTALLRTSKQIHAEATDFPYNTSAFKVWFNDTCPECVERKVTNGTEAPKRPYRGLVILVGLGISGDCCRQTLIDYLLAFTCHSKESCRPLPKEVEIALNDTFSASTLMRQSEGARLTAHFTGVGTFDVASAVGTSARKVSFRNAPLRTCWDYLVSLSPDDRGLLAWPRSSRPTEDMPADVYATYASGHRFFNAATAVLRGYYADRSMAPGGADGLRRWAEVEHDQVELKVVTLKLESLLQ